MLGVTTLSALGACQGARATPAPLVPTPPAQATNAPSPHLGPVTGVVPLGRSFASCSQAGVAWSAADADVAPTPLRVFAIAARDAHTLVLAGGAPGRTGEVAVLTANGVGARRALGDDVCYAVAVAPDGTQIAVGDADGRVRTLSWPDLADLDAHVPPVHTAVCRAVAFAPDGTYLASAGLDGVVHVRTTDGTALRLTDHTAGIECLAISPGSDRLASGARDGKVRIHTRDGRLRRTFGRLGAEVLAVVWQDEHALFAGMSDGRVLALVDEGDGEVRERTRVEGAVYALAYRDGVLAVASEGRVKLVAMAGR